MTDSGFSSATSNRSASSIIKPALLNSFLGSHGTTSATSKGYDKENVGLSSTGSSTGLPKPCTYLQSSGGRSLIPNRLLYARNHGGYSPGVYSPKESMSPMSSLAFDFRELNTSHETNTPRKRLSLSSVSSLESPHPLGNPSPATLPCALNLNSPSVDNDDDEGCFADTPSPLDHGEMEAKFERALQNRDDNIIDTSAYGDGKLNSYRRFKSMPGSTKGRFRFGGFGNECAGKENSPLYGTKKQMFSHRRCSIDNSPSPMSPMASPSPFNAMRRLPPSTLLKSPSMTSSPVVPHFAASSLSAFSAVARGATKEDASSVNAKNKREEQLCRDAEERLRGAVSPRDRSLTPEKSVVPGSIASLSARTNRIARPSSAVSFSRAKSYPSCTGHISPIPVRGNKRSLDATTNSMSTCCKRPKCSGSSFMDSDSRRRKMAFASKDRKTRSADAALMHSSPVASMKSDFRPISAPAQMLCFDDDQPLSHSRLCSSNDSDFENGDLMISSEHDRSDADERLLEKMLSENVRELHDGEDTCDDMSAIPEGLDGLITAPLLLSASVIDKGKDNSMVAERMPKPRELFRSPSAPPVVPTKRSLLAIRRSELQGDSATPFGIKRRRPVCNRRQDEVRSLDLTSPSDIPETEEEPNTSLNRSRSFNELDIMRAVDLGCSDPNLVGDFSRVCCLQTVSGKHQDLKYISPQTLINLINEKHETVCFGIIDCRYPYEYEGGHVVSADNFWEEKELFKMYFNNPKPMWASQSNGNYKPPVLVFYCEFSSERGPRMARALRNRDRELNRYPHLHYPELYILKDGYKNFYHTKDTKAYCEPPSYRPMAHEDYAKELRMCRAKSKTWAGEKTKCGHYNRLKRL
ncbi:unnamed protein product [Clavelina lepadiformis]|uniref:protein-tyrosine-phosphatase n=1 Tax=Clavelina lepadiformis TaxID=159417 RepID=A0ABP0GCQ9_CLALP